MRRLLFVRHATTAAVRRAAFGTDEPIDEGGRRAAAALAGTLPRFDAALVSPALRAQQTAAAAGVSDPVVEPALAECDFGRWAGRSLAEVNGDEPTAVRLWMTDPGAAPHGGESLTQMLARVGDWLRAQAALDGTAVAVTHGGVVKAAVVCALDAPPAAFWRVDASPCGVTELHSRGDGWTVTRVNERPSP
jgi:broad specificity phosphatase PhoE